MESTPTKHVYSGQKEKTERLEEMALLMHHCTKKHLRGERDSRQSHCFFVLWRMLATFVVQNSCNKTFLHEVVLCSGRRN